MAAGSASTFRFSLFAVGILAILQFFVFPPLRNQALESDDAKAYNAAGKTINAVKKADLDDNAGDPAPTTIAATDVKQQAETEKNQLQASIGSKLNAARKYKSDCTPQHGKGVSFAVNEYPGKEPCRFKNNMVYWSEWVPIGNDIEISYVPLSLRQDRLYGIADGAARLADYGYYRFRLAANHDPKVKVGGRVFIYYLKDDGKEDKTFQPLFFDAAEETKQEGIGMWYLGHKITRVVWDGAQCWDKN